MQVGAATYHMLLRRAPGGTSLRLCEVDGSSEYVVTLDLPQIRATITFVEELVVQHDGGAESLVRGGHRRSGLGRQLQLGGP